MKKKIAWNGKGTKVDLPQTVETYLTLEETYKTQDVGAATLTEK